MSKHTPGPWKVRFFGKVDDGENMFFVEAKNNNKPDIGYGIEIMQEDFGYHNGYPREQRLADAKLIAASPDLLQAIVDAEKDLTDIMKDVEIFINDTRLQTLRNNLLRTIKTLANE